MNPKRWFAWLCLALMLVAEILLFHAVREKDAALTATRDTQSQMRQLQKDLDDLKNSNTGLQFAEIVKLHKQIDIYTNRLAKAQAMIDQLETESAQSAQSLATARAALSLQQQHLQDLQTENKLVTDAGLTIIHRNTCINNLREIDAAKAQWALDKNKPGDAVPRPEDLLPYLKDGVFPACPDGGTYYLNSVDTVPTCNIQGHVLPQ
jgi:septal ring factor EnvC (AmiA/AmiB activator)